MEGELSVATSGWFISRKKGFSVLNGQYGNEPRAGLSVMQEGLTTVRVGNRNSAFQHIFGTLWLATL
jgi:glycine betaine/choline ABC-type transport system substrate-binding protein